MKISVQEKYFTDPATVFEEIEARGLHSMEMKVPPVTNDSHWHIFSTRIYILDGELNITDSARNLTFKAGPGSMVEVPERVLHSEHSPSGYSIIAGLTANPESMTGPIDLDPKLL